MRKKSRQEIEQLIWNKLEDSFPEMFMREFGKCWHQHIQDSIIHKINMERKKDIVHSSIPSSLTGSQKELFLLSLAKEKGYFNRNKCFNAFGGWTDTAFFTHSPSEILSNYYYYSEKDSLCIPVIGVRGNFSAGTVTIYKRGEWAHIEDYKPE